MPEPSADFRQSRAAELDRESWRLLSDAVAALEQAWQFGREPEIDALLPAATSEIRELILVELIKTDQECRLQHGSFVPLEEYLANWPAVENRPELIRELMVSELTLRREAGEGVTPSEYQRRFPSIADVMALRRLLDDAPEGNLDDDDFPSRDAAASTKDAHGRLPVPGESFNRYEVRCRQGAGAMGRVYRAYDPHLDREVALKVPLQTFDRPDMERRFLREGRAMARIRHPHVCTVLEAGVHEGVHYLCMEYIEGPTLAERLKDGTVPPRPAAELVKKIARGVDCLHRQNLIHRDIKPENILIDPHGEPVLTDFGLSFPVDGAASLEWSGVNAEGAATGRDARDEVVGDLSFSGTPAYMAPERFDASGNSGDERSDVYSLGVLLIHLCTGRPPFAGTVEGVRHAARHGPRPSVMALRHHMDAELALIGLKCIDPDPAKRYPSAAALAEALEGYLSRPISKIGPWHAAIAAMMLATVLALAALRNHSRDGAPLTAPGLRSSATRAGTSREKSIVVSAKEMVTWRKKLASYAARIASLDKGAAADAKHPDCAAIRRDLLVFLRSLPPDEIAVEAGRLLCRLPWPKYAESAPSRRWWRRGPAGDGAASDPGPRTDSGEIELPPGGTLVLRGVSGREFGEPAVRLRLSRPQPLGMQVIALLPGQNVRVRESWDNGKFERSNTEATNQFGYRLVEISDVYPSPHNWHRLTIEREPREGPPVEYLVHIWQATPERPQGE